MSDKLADLVDGGSGPLMIDKGVCRTSPATPGLLILYLELFCVTIILDFLVLGPTILIIN
jgi:hypothetical protein